MCVFIEYIKYVFSNQNSVRQNLVKTKSKNDTLDTKNCFFRVIYECDRKYINDLNRPLNTV